MKKHEWQPIIDRIRASSKILLTTHINPDGDGLGAEAAMFHALTEIGKQPVIINDSSLSQEYQFLNNGQIFETYNSSAHQTILQNIDLVIVFDIGSPDRLGRLGKDLVAFGCPMICIDHHPDNHGRFQIAVIDTDAPATVSLVFELIMALDTRLMNKKIAESLYTGILTDTGSFRFDNITSEGFEMAAELMRYGVKPSEIYAHIYENSTPERTKLLGMILQEIHFDLEGRLAWFIITQKQIRKSGAKTEEVDGFTEVVRSIKGVEVAIMFLEVSKNRVRINFRSKGNFIINRVAQMFNGGGHPFAAGAALDTTIDEIVDKVLTEVRKLIV